MLIGDSVDDVAAADECGVRCMVYHAGADALHHRSHFESVASSLVAAVESVLDEAAGADRRDVAGRRLDACEGQADVDQAGAGLPGDVGQGQP